MYLTYNLGKQIDLSAKAFSSKGSKKNLQKLVPAENPLSSRFLVCIDDLYTRVAQ